MWRPESPEEFIARVADLLGIQPERARHLSLGTIAEVAHAKAVKVAKPRISVQVVVTVGEIVDEVA